MSAAPFERKPTVIRIPIWLHRQLRLEAASSDRSMNDIVTEELANRYSDPASPFFSPQSELEGHTNSEVNILNADAPEKVAPQTETAPALER